MKKPQSFLWLSLLAVSMTVPALGRDAGQIASMAKPAVQPDLKAKPPGKETTQAAATGASKPKTNAEKPAGAHEKPATATQPSAAAEPNAGAESTSTAAQTPPAPPPSPSQVLSQAYENYQKNPTPATFAELQRVVKQLIASVGTKVPAAMLIKANPALANMGARAIDAGNGRIWVFGKLPDSREVLLQWADTKTTITYVGRRRRHKKVTSTTVWRIGSATLPPDVTLEQARILGTGEGEHSVILVGALKGSELWLHTYKQSQGSWAETASRFDSIPAFLTHNVSGKVSFRGPDLIFNVARVVPGQEEGSTTNLAEAESSTYRFWLHLTDQGYVLMTHLPDEAQFQTVRTFLEALASSHTDAARSLLLDARLLSIPKYVGIHGPSNTYRVAQLASPPSGAPRFRLVTGSKNDLIFEVIHVKDKPMIRAIFIAPPDPFLQEIANHLPTYDKVAPSPGPQPEQVSDRR